ncbi:acetyl-CoA acetyltransferase [Herbaspirillum huttiense]|uniref:acetyl-CoA acetyltransferase n=1 Tax=Herbaspirillum huttiense TaxID=863372 RepID=UPI00041FAE75|nr:acetyl-CoA acetyltransferase [Herbaspirillum huttiense]
MTVSASSPCITGWNHSQFGKLDGIDPEVLIGQVAKAAIEHAGLQPGDIDSVHFGTFNAGFLYQDFPSSLVLNTLPQLRFKPATRLENACATGSAAIHSGLQAIKAGESKHVLVIGFEKMTELATAQVGEVLLKACYAKEEAGIPGGFAGVFGKIAQSYFDRFGDQSDALALIAAKNHKNGMVNPYAHMRKDFGFDFCRNVSDKNPYVAGPLKRTDCSLISDGAAALILSAADVAKTMQRAVTFRAAVHVNDFLPLSRRDPTRFEAGTLAWQQALKQADLKLLDLSLVETHDCFTVAELLEYEAMGLAEPGATGVSMHVMAAMQASHDAGDMQIANARYAGVFNMGGAAVANYVSILERVN